MSCSNYDLPKKEIKCGDYHPNRIKWAFKDGKAYQDGQLIGDIIFLDIDKKHIKVKHNNGSFMDGTIREFFLTD